MTNLNIIHNKDRQIDLKDFENGNDAISVSSSKNEEGIPWEKIITALEEKAESKSSIRKNKLKYFMLLIGLATFMAIATIFFQNLR